jgi:hypothetical protein
MEVFKIKDKDGTFSTGGLYPRWTSRGKVWGSQKALKCHLRQFCKDLEFGEDNKTVKGWWNNIPKGWKVVELSESGIKEYSAKGLYPLTTGRKL